MDFESNNLFFNKNEFYLCNLFIMKVFFYLKTCDTCKRIINELNLSSDIELVDIKVNPLNKQQLQTIRSLSTSFKDLFNKRAQLYKHRNLNTKILSESDYEKLILEHYTFLKRPVLLYDNKLFVGNSKNTIEQIKKFLDEK